MIPVPVGNKLVIAVYNDQGWRSAYWKKIKKAYNGTPLVRPVILAVHMPVLLGMRFLYRALTGRLNMDRGMSMWNDFFDWIGGYPFEVATREEIIQFLNERGLVLIKLISCGDKSGNNQFLFERINKT